MIKSQNCFLLMLISLSVMLFGCNKEEEPNSGNNGRGTIMGVVTDFATGEPVANANVRLRPGGETTLTGSDGRFEFLDIKNGSYSLTVSKAEYTELIDDYVIEVRDGKTMRRDVQIKKLPTTIAVLDNYGYNLSSLDFGSDESTVSRSFNIFNNGTMPIKCSLVYSCNWISKVSSLPSSLSPGSTTGVTVTINRSRLSSGRNSTILTVSTNNGSAEITITAECASGNPPTVDISGVNSNDITATSVNLEGYIRNTNGGNIKECGFCYSTSYNPTVSDNVIRMSATYSRFNSTINNLKAGTTYHCRAYAISNLGTGYSQEITFTTTSGLPTCGSTSITNIGTTTAKATSSVISSDGNKIIERGFCWSTSRNPTIYDYSVQYIAAEGSFSEYLSDLRPNTTYYVKSYAKTSYGIAYGSEANFTTSSGKATVTTTSPYISGENIITGGTITQDAGDYGEYVYDRGVCYGFSQNPDTSDSYYRTYNGSGEGTFSSVIPIYLLKKKGYLYIRAFASTRYGTTYGNQRTIYIP